MTLTQNLPKTPKQRRKFTQGVNFPLNLSQRRRIFDEKLIWAGVPLSESEVSAEPAQSNLSQKAPPADLKQPLAKLKIQKLPKIHKIHAKFKLS